MPVYRIKAEARDVPDPKTIGYKKPTLVFASDVKQAQNIALTPKDAADWLRFTWQHFKRSWTTFSSNSIWKGYRLDQVRLVLEEVPSDPKGEASVVETTVDWDNMPTVTSGTTTNYVQGLT